jgi:hypothetical protein
MTLLCSICNQPIEFFELELRFGTIRIYSHIIPANMTQEESILWNEEKSKLPCWTKAVPKSGQQAPDEDLEVAQ